VHRGAGVKISKKASPTKIAAAVHQVLTDPSFRAAALALGEQVRGEANSGAAIAELEALTARTRRSAP
jgi:UDP:flavonoid glycosyltransferase YjiC (YdhE family)